MSEMDYAKMMFGWANEPTNPGDGSYSSNSSVRYGTVVKVNDDGTIDVKLDGSGAVVTVKADAPHNVGDRVSVVNQGGVFLIYGMAGTLDAMEKANDALAKQIEKKGEEILESAKADIDEVDKAFAAFKKSHTLTDADITSKITTSGNELSASFQGQIDDLGETYAKKTDVKADIEGFRTEMSENYQSKTDAGSMQKDLESKIQQTTDAITTEVTNRTEAVSGALKDAKSYTDQQAESISSTVERNVTNSIGETYATKTEVRQASDSLHVTVSGEISTAKTDVKNDLADDISTAQDDASSALSKANSANNFIETHFEATTSGLTVSSSASSYKARVSPGSFDILNGSDSKVFTLGVTNGYASIQSVNNSFIGIRGSSSTYGWLKVGSVIDVNGSSYDFGMKRTGGSQGTGWYYAWHSLYSNSSGTAGTVTLSYPANNFQVLVIMFAPRGDLSGDPKPIDAAVVPGSASYASLSTAYYFSGGGSYADSRLVQISGRSISTYGSWEGRGWIGESEAVAAAQKSVVKITAVYGLKY